MAYRAISEQQIQEMREYGNAGFSYADIAKEMNIAPHTVSKYLGGKYKQTDEDLIKKMEKLRDQGLSNSQIASDLGISVNRVTAHIGKQKAMNRAAWGSLSSHSTGSMFGRSEQMNTAKLKQVKTSISWDGKEFAYKASTDGKVRITSPTGTATDFTREQFLNFVAELCEVSEWLEENTVKPSVMLNHQ